jgi:hypothetical protein
MEYLECRKKTLDEWIVLKDTQFHRCQQGHVWDVCDISVAVELDALQSRLAHGRQKLLHDEVLQVGCDKARDDRVCGQINKAIHGRCLWQVDWMQTEKRHMG